MIHQNRGELTYPFPFFCNSSAAEVFPNVVIATPAMLTTTETTLTIFIVSSPSNAPIKRVNNPEVEDSNVVLATLVRASAAFVKYCRHTIIFNFVSHNLTIY